MKTATGKIKWFSSEKKFGFVEPDEDYRILFIHRTFIRDADVDSFKVGMRVSYEPYQGPKGLEARNVRLLQKSK